MRHRIKTAAFLGAVLLVAAGVLSACGSKGTEEASEGASSRSKSLFEGVTMETLAGDSVDESLFSQADLTMINVWGTFCGPCIKEMPELGELSREYEGKGMQIAGIITDVSTPGDETAQEIIGKTGADYTHIIMSPELKNGALGSVQVVPTTLFVDQDGKQVGQIYTGARSKEAWSDIIEELLSEVRA